MSTGRELGPSVPRAAPREAIDSSPPNAPDTRLTIMQVLHQGGGAGSVISTLHLSVGLSRRGHRIRFVCPPDSEVEAEARQAGLEVDPLRLEPHRRRVNARAVEEMLARHPVQLVNSQSARDREALTWLGLTGRLTVPVVFTRRQMPRTFWLENWLAGRIATGVVAVSRAVGEALVRRGTPRRKLVVIPNGVVTERIDRPVSISEIDRWRAMVGWESGRRTLGIVARPKDQAVVLRALGMVETPVRLICAGVDPDGPLRDLATQVPARHTVVLLPYHPEVRPLYELLEIALLPSRSEGLSQGLLEAMALSKPVIASDCAGNRELIDDRVDGLLVTPTDHAAWAQAIEQILQDPGLASRLGQAARVKAREQFSLEHTIRRTEALYRQILNGGQ